MPSKGSKLDNCTTQRVAAGLTLDGLAKKAGLNDFYVQQVEIGGNVEAYEGQRIADALGVSLVTLGEKKL